MELTGQDDEGSDRIYPNSRFCLPVACYVYFPGTHDSPGEGVDHNGYTLGEAVEEETLVYVQLAVADNSLGAVEEEGVFCVKLAAVCFVQLLAVAPAAIFLVLPRLDY